MLVREDNKAKSTLRTTTRPPQLGPPLTSPLFLSVKKQYMNHGIFQPPFKILKGLQHAGRSSFYNIAH